MKRDREHRWLDELLDAHVHRQPEFDFDEWSRVHPDEARLLRKGAERTTCIEERTFNKTWRRIMESPITRYSATAAVILAAALVVLNPFQTSGNGVVLADVQRNVDGIETLIIRGTKTFTHRDRPDAVFEFGGFNGRFDLMKYFSKEHGLVEEGYTDGQLIYRITLNRSKQKALLLLPLYSKYVTFASTESQMRLLDNGTPTGVINLLMACEYEKLGTDIINGTKTEIFQFQDPGTFKDLLPKAIFDIQAIQGKVWIAVKEELPVRVEGDLTIGKSFMTMFNDLNLHEVNTFGDFNIALDETIFSTDPPEGYTEITLGDILQFIPMKAKAGLFGLGLAPMGLFCLRRRRRKTTCPK